MNWNKFTICALGGTFLMMLLGPLWGHFVADLRDAYKFDFVYGLYIVLAPYLVFWTFLLLWLYRGAKKMGLL